MNREIRPLPRAIDREKPQGHDSHPVKMRIGGTQKFARDFRRCIRADRLGEMQILRERNGLGDAVNRRTGSEEEALNAGEARRFEQMQRAGDVRVVIQLRRTDRWSNAGARGEVSDRIEFFPMKQATHRAAVAQIDLMQRDVIHDSSNVCALDLRIVEVVEVIEDRDFVAQREQLLGKM